MDAATPASATTSAADAPPAAAAAPTTTAMAATTSTATKMTTTTTTTATTATDTDTDATSQEPSPETGLPPSHPDDTTTIVTESESGELSTSTAPSLSSALADLSVAPSAVGSPSSSRPDTPTPLPGRPPRDEEGGGGSGGGQTLTEYRLDLLQLGVDRRLLLNRKRQLKMFRVWMQGRWRKPFDTARGDSVEGDSSK